MSTYDPPTSAFSQTHSSPKPLSSFSSELEELAGIAGVYALG
jgi:hypothetical protein